MARGRMVSKSLSTSKKWNALPTWFSRMLYVLLIVHADDYGIVDGDAEEVKWKLSPGAQEPPSAFEAALCDLARADLVHRFNFNGHHLIEIILFDQHQQGLHKRSERRFPSYAEVSGNFREFPGISGGALEDSDGVPESPGNSGGFPLNRRELNRRELKRSRATKSEEPVENSGVSSLSANADGRASEASSAEGEEEKTKTKELLVKGEEVGRTESIPAELPPDSRLSQKPKKPTDPRIKQFIDSYYAAFLKAFGSPPKVDGPKDGKLVKGLLGTFDLPFLLGLLDSFFSVSDDWIEQTGYTIGVFSTQVNKLIVANAGRPKNSQTHEIDWDEWRKKEEERKNARRNLARGD